MSLRQQNSPPVQLEHRTFDSGSIGLRVCSKCQVAQPLANFYAEKRGRGGRRYSCKTCDRNRKRAYMAARTKPRVRRRKTEAEYSLAYRKKHRAKELVRHAKRRAERIGLPFDLDQHVAEIQLRVDAGLCELTGLPMRIQNGRHWDAPSLDRIKPEEGYVLGNIRVVCLAVNCALGFWGADVLLKIANALQE